MYFWQHNAIQPVEHVLPSGRSIAAATWLTMENPVSSINERRAFKSLRINHYLKIPLQRFTPILFLLSLKYYNMFIGFRRPRHPSVGVVVIMANLLSRPLGKLETKTSATSSRDQDLSHLVSISVLRFYHQVSRPRLPLSIRILTV